MRVNVVLTVDRKGFADRILVRIDPDNTGRLLTIASCYHWADLLARNPWLISEARTIRVRNEGWP
jgi:hypothetical protein